MTSETFSSGSFQSAEREAARMGFGGSAPCAQRNGEQKFITKHPKQYLMDAINDESSQPKKAIFGANKHEGSFVLGSRVVLLKVNYISFHFLSDLQLLHSS